jgi:hypothetical protein
MRPYLKKKNNHHKNRARGVAQDVDPELKPQHQKKKRKYSIYKKDGKMV